MLDPALPSPTRSLAGRALPRAAIVAGLVLSLSSGGRAYAQPPSVRPVDDLDAINSVSVAEAEGVTYVAIDGSMPPLFTAYKLSAPDRIVIELARSHLSGASASLEAGTWAVGTISSSDVVGDGTTRTRVIIELVRPASYVVTSHDRQLVVTITPDQVAPAGQGGGKVVAPPSGAGTAKIDDAERAARQDEQTAAAEKQAADAALAAARRTQTDADRAKATADAEQAEVQQAKKDAQAALDEALAQRDAALAAARDARKAEALAEARAKAARAEQAAAERASQEAREEEVGAEREAKSEQAAAEHAAQRATAAQAAQEKAEASLAAARSQRDLLRSAVAAEKASLAADQKAADSLKEGATKARAARDEAEAQVAVATQARAREEAAAKDAEAQRAAAEEATAQAQAALEAIDAKKVASERAAQSAQVAAQAARDAAAKAEALRAAGAAAHDQAAADAAVAKARTEQSEAEAAARDAVIALAAARNQAATAQSVATAAEARAGAAREALESAQKSRIAEEEKRDQVASQADATRSDLERLTAARESEQQKLASLKQEEAKAQAALDAAQAAARAVGRRATARQRALAAEQAKAEAAETRAEAAQARAASQAQAASQAEAEADQAKQTADGEIAREKDIAATAEKQKKAAEQARTLAAAQAARAREETAAEVAAAARLEDRTSALQPSASALEATPGAGSPAGGLPRVTDVQFADRSEYSEVILSLTGPGAGYSVLPLSPTRVRLVLSGATVPKSVEQRLDATAYHGPVRDVAIFDGPGGQGLVDVDLAEPVSNHVAQGQAKLVWRFEKPAPLASDGLVPTAVSYPAPQVGQYAGSTVRSARPAMPATPIGVDTPKIYHGVLIDLDFKDADIHNVLRILSDYLRINIVASDDVKGTVTIKLKNVHADQALDVILKSKQLGYVKEGANIYRIEPQEVIDKEQQALAARLASQAQAEPIVPRYVRLNYANALKLYPRILPLVSSRGRLAYDDRTNTIIIDDVASNGRLIEDMLHRLDTQTPAVMIEARIVEADTGYTRQLGIQWGGNFIGSQATGNPTGLLFPNTIGIAGGGGATPTTGLQGPGAVNPNFAVNLPAAVGVNEGGALGLTLGSVSSNFNINLRLSALEDTSELRIVSAPKISALDNMPATISQGESIPIQVVSALGANTQFVQAVLSLTVTPHVSTDGNVMMHVEVKKDEPDFADATTAGPPIFTKEATSDILVKDGDTAVIGGIYTRNSGLTYHKVPWIADIPIIGWFFKSRSDSDKRTEVLVFLTPHVLNYAASVTAGQESMTAPPPTP